MERSSVSSRVHPYSQKPKLKYRILISERGENAFVEVFVARHSGTSGGGCFGRVEGFNLDTGDTH